MEISRAEQPLLAEFRRLSLSRRQELMVVARGQATVSPLPAVPTNGQCGHYPARSPEGNDPVFTQ